MKIEKEKEIDINVIILGDKGVGKTSIFNKLKEGASNENNNKNINDIDCINIKRKYEKKNKIISLNIKDIKNQDNFKGNIPIQYIHNNNIILLVFSDIKTLNNIKEKWYKYCNENINNIKYILIGNKCDEFGNEEKEIKEQGQKFAEEIDAHFITCSTYSKDNMDNLERFIITESKNFIDNIDKKVNNNTKRIILERENPNNNYCCHCDN